jgi:L-asparaginase II
MHPVPLVATTRGYPDSGYVTENVHMGSVAVVDASGRLLWSAGDPGYPSFTRSALKPFQALPFVLDGGVDKLKLSRDELALLCASHSGEDKHVHLVRGMLDRLGLDEHHLECGCQVPLYYDFVNLPAPPDRRWTTLHHNCSGKHTGFLAWCRLHGAPTERYVDPRHPLQQAIRARLAEAVQLGADQLPTGIDGCSAPNYALPLSRLAQLYARLAQGERDAEYGGAFGMLFDAMTTRPDLVSGEERSDLHLMTAGRGDWVCKVGADAVQTVGVRSAGIGIAIKIADGASRALHTVTYRVLEQLGLMDEHARRVLERYRQPAIKNARGVHAGDIRAVFELTKAGPA